MTLRYPQEIGGAALPDYMQFTPQKYRSNRGPNSADGGAAPGQSGAQAVILYMPNSTPPASNVNEWGDTGNTLAGPLGDVKRSIGRETANTIMNSTDMESVIDNTVEGLKSVIQDNKFVDAGRQLGMQMAAEVPFMASPIQLMSIEQNKVYNPNIELFYKQPRVRSFNLTFRMIPKNPAEALIVNQIVFNFKRWSSPAKTGGGMFEIPHVWEIKYKSGGADNGFMNRFKRCACTNVTAQANPGTTMHVAHDLGAPIETVLSLGFMEVDIITRDDHVAVGGQGF